MLDVIDAGHEGSSLGLDCGAVGKCSEECNITLKFSKILGEKFKLKGETVVYTREGDLKQNTYQKAAIANNLKADRFISIHCNSYSDPKSNGVETYICKGAKGETLELATRVQSALVKSSGLKNRGVKEANYDVLVKTTMPAILIELGFISNVEEEKLMNDDRWLDKVATAICDAVLGKGVGEVVKEIKINLDGEVKKVNAIEKDGHNYVMLQDIRTKNIAIDYDSKNKMPIIKVVK